MNSNRTDAGPRAAICARRESLSLRDVADVLFRRKLLITLGLLLITGATASFVKFAPEQYQSEMLLLVKNDRPEPGTTSGPNVLQIPRDTAEAQIATEIALLSSDEILTKVIVANGLASTSTDPAAIDLALRAFKKKLRIIPGLKSNVISVSIAWNSPEKATALLRTLADVYLEKHLQIHKVTGSLEFFEQEVAGAERELREAQQALANFEQQNNTVSLDQQKTQAVKNLADMEAGQRSASVDLREAEDRTRTLETQLTATAARITTQSRTIPNQYSTERLNTMLVELRNKRTELLTKYQPTDRMVQEIDQQIAQTLSALDEARKQTAREEATDVNPIRQTLEADLLQARNRQAGTGGRLQAMTVQGLRLRRQLDRMSAITGAHDDLTRKLKDAEAHYQVLSSGLEQARIAENLDRLRIANVVVAEAPTDARVPAAKLDTNLIAGVALGLILVIGAAAISGMRRRKVFTPWELEGIAGVPVLGAIPLARGSAAKALPPASPAHP